MFMKRPALLSAMALSAVLLLNACSGGGSDSASMQPSASSSGSAGGDQKQVKLSFFSTASEDSLVQNYRKVLDAFMEENPNIKVEVTFPGADYENIMKVKMASKDIPDVFQTHGWAKARYGSFLEDLRDEPWAEFVSPSIKDVVTDEDGKLYALPITQQKSGINYNVDLLQEYGIAVPTTWEQFVAACETILQKSGGQVTPIHIGGSDSWPLGVWYNMLAIPYLISPTDNSAPQLLDGSFDWHKWDYLSEQLRLFYEKGYLNKDVLTAKYVDSSQLMAQGKIAFTLYGSGIVPEVQRLNPDIHLSMMPIPTMVAGDKPVWTGGEGDTVGIFKDSPNKDAARKLLSFFAEPDNAKTISGSSLEPGLTNVPSDMKDAYTDLGEELRIFPVFDRDFLPNGMWDVMCKNAQDLLAGGITTAEFSSNMAREYERLRNQQQSSQQQ
ncbi:ABC transporter substrate-binding protein [Cohnella cellulosilytica]